MKKLICLLLFILCNTDISNGADVHYFGQSPDDTVSAVNYGNNPQAGHYVKADDALIYYEVYGAGEPVLVLHGGGVGCTYEMGRFIDNLAENYTVIAPSTRGHGKSETGIKKITYEQKADDMIEAVNRVTKKPVIILGFSDGAYTAYKIAAMYPKRVKKIIAIGAGENIPALRKIPVNTLNDLEKADKRFIDEKISLSPDPDKLQNFLNEYYTFFNNERISKNIFGKIQCPVLIIAGELDQNAPLDTIINAYKMIPNSHLAIIANAPHQVFITNFDAVWSSIEAFLKD